MSKYTKGPWKAHKKAEAVGYAEWEIHWSADGECVADVVYTESDAKLIAASPELLEMLEHLLERAVSRVPLWSSEITEARQLISKAKGE